MPSTDIDRAVNGDARSANLSMLRVSISLGRHWRHCDTRSELGEPLELQRVELFHLRLLWHTATTRVRVPVKTEVKQSDALSRERFPQLRTQQTESRRSSEGEKFRSRRGVGPYIYKADSVE